MKKLMIAAAIVCAAAMSQAAQFAWNGWGTHENEDWYSGGQAYLIMLDSDSLSVSSQEGQIVLDGGHVVSSTDINGGLAAANDDMAELGFVAGQTASFAILFTDSGVAGTALPTEGLYGLNDNDGTYYTVTFDKDTGAAFQNDNTWAVVNQEIAAVPEPTSGLLLLIGMAGLALRRRRA